MTTEGQFTLQEEVFQNGVRDGLAAPWLPWQSMLRKQLLPSGEVLSKGFHFRPACASEASCFMALKIGTEKNYFS